MISMKSRLWPTVGQLLPVTPESMTRRARPVAGITIEIRPSAPSDVQASAGEPRSPTGSPSRRNLRRVGHRRNGAADCHRLRRAHPSTRPRSWLNE